MAEALKLDIFVSMMAMSFSSANSIISGVAFLPLVSITKLIPAISTVRIVCKLANPVIINNPSVFLMVNTSLIKSDVNALSKSNAAVIFMINIKMKNIFNQL